MKVRMGRLEVRTTASRAVEGRLARVIIEKVTDVAEIGAKDEAAGTAGARHGLRRAAGTGPVRGLTLSSTSAIANRGVSASTGRRQRESARARPAHDV